MAKVKLGDICEIVSGSTPKTSIDEYWDGDIDWITPAEISEDTYIVEESVRKLTQLGVEKTGLKPFPKGTVILSSRAPSGKVAIAGKEMYCNQGFKNLICSDKVLPEYLYWFLRGNTAYLNSLGRGATFKEISKGIVAEIEINLPDKKEQQLSVDTLKKVWDVIVVRRQELEQLDLLIKARFVEMFGSIYDNKFGYNVRTLQDVCEPIKDGTHQTPTYIDDSINGFKFLSSKDVTTGKIDWNHLKYIPEELHNKLYKRISPRKGDILLAKNGTTGVAAIVDKDEVLEIIKEVRLKLPDELKQAKWVKEERQRILEEAQKEADDIVKEAENRIISMIDEHEITRKAYEKKAEIIETANEMSREISKGTKDYADNILAGLEVALEDALKIVQNNRKELQ